MPLTNEKRSTYSSISAADICIESNRQRHAKAKQVINVLTEEAIKLNVIMKSTQIRPLPCDKLDNLFYATFMSLAMHLTSQTGKELDIRGIGNM